MTVVGIAVAQAAAGENSTEIQVCAGAVEKLESEEIIVVPYDASVVAVTVPVGYASDVFVVNSYELVDDDTVGVLVSKFVAAVAAD